MTDADRAAREQQIRERVEGRFLCSNDVWCRCVIHEQCFLLDQLAAERATGQQLREEHQACLDGDTAWAEKWRAKYEQAGIDLAAERARHAQLEQAIRWVLGEVGTFEPSERKGRFKQPFWWRSELRKRAALAASSQTPEATK